MRKEVIVVFDEEGRAIYWHDQNATAGYVPDSDALFNFLWENKDRLGGFAHTHPGIGYPIPSHIDLRTFEGLEKSLGKQLLWPILTFDQMLCVVRNPLYTEEGAYAKWTKARPLTIEFDWIDELRRRSGSEDAPSP